MNLIFAYFRSSANKASHHSVTYNIWHSRLPNNTKCAIALIFAYFRNVLSTGDKKSLKESPLKKAGNKQFCKNKSYNMHVNKFLNYRNRK